MRHPARLAPGAEASGGGGVAELCHLGLVRSRQPDSPPLCSPLSRKLDERIPQKRCKIIRCMYQALTLPLSQGITSHVASTGEALIMNDVREAPDFYVSCSLATRAELAVPLPGNHGRPIGVLNVESQQRNAFLPEDRDIFQAIAAGLTRAIENACQRTRLNALHDLSTTVGKAQNLDEVLGALLSTVTAHFNISATAIYLWDAPT